MDYQYQKKEKVEKNYNGALFLYSPIFHPLVNTKILSRLRFSLKSDTMSQRQQYFSSYLSYES